MISLVKATGSVAWHTEGGHSIKYRVSGASSMEITSAFLLSLKLSVSPRLRLVSTATHETVISIWRKQASYVLYRRRKPLYWLREIFSFHFIDSKIRRVF